MAAVRADHGHREQPPQQQAAEALHPREEEHEEHAQQHAARQQPDQQQPPLLPPLPPGAEDPATIVRVACEMLALPPRVACTALTFLRRAGDMELPPERVAAACTFLAAKVEEASARTNDLLNAVAAWRPCAATDATALARLPCLVGDSYQAQKRQLIQDEQQLLRRLRFDIHADQPHRYLYVLAHCWGASRDATRVATCLLNDCVCQCPAYGSGDMLPVTAATAALQLAAQLCGQEVQPAGWWRAMGVSDQDLAAVQGALLRLLQQTPGT